ncbi:Predicted amidophosphoribosyltransferases [Frankineae bacterium MT45]|nr:Predicted amidophosphoribosyltransferases [Frankineae bacterium MT45]
MSLLSRSPLADLLFPNYCGGCARPGPLLCLNCHPRGELLQVPVPGVRCFAAARYEGALRRALLHYKERGRHDAAPALGHLLADAVQAAVTGIAGGFDELLLVPIPSARGASRRRGGDHVRRLAESAARSLTVTSDGVAPPVVGLLALNRRVRDAAGLTRDERAANLAGAMVVRAVADGASRVLLVDDIVTTGATVVEAARALRDGGWTVPGAATVAATRPKAGIDRQTSG